MCVVAFNPVGDRANNWFRDGQGIRDLSRVLQAERTHVGCQMRMLVFHALVDRQGELEGVSIERVLQQGSYSCPQLYLQLQLSLQDETISSSTWEVPRFGSLEPTGRHAIVVERSPGIRGFAADCPILTLFKPSRLSFQTALWW